MGISGLLPLLKPIQKHQRLSEYSGQTIAVDAYVWLHRGTFTCATDLATGKKTSKYVDYAMQRVRLLQHYNIIPYIVFDGGPLPAKKGTESERKKKREENLARANSLAAQGKHSQAREYYVKCIDVTPQMAFQFIKALRAENVAYVVAPYEADAQMAYMERAGLVDGVLTEDSDLLVFGCKTVLLKLDYSEHTVISISRQDFASLSVSSGGGISLLGWSDVQFRAMAILSGCDYLPSIPNVGLKTAWSLLRKHGSVENVIRALRIEGKKSVPQGYLQAFRLAEKVFLHQRVYDPLKHMLVHLSPLADGEEWDEEKEAHVGRYIEPSLARKVAEGDACPITLLPMVDINPTFVPRALKPIPMNSLAAASAKRKGKEKMTISEKARGESILTFLTPKTQGRPNPQTQPNAPATVPRIASTRPVVGQSSGKRTLAEVMDDDIASKKQRCRDREGLNKPTTDARLGTSSKFFSGPLSSRPGKNLHASITHDPFETEPVAGPSGSSQVGKNKENIPCLRCADDDNGSEISMDEAADPVTQEDGYMSPSPSFARWDSPELSSPVRPRTRRPDRSAPTQDLDESEDEIEDFDAEVLSSPGDAARKRHRARRVRRVGTPPPLHSAGNVLVHGTPTPRKKRGRGGSPLRRGPDLRDIFENWSEGTSDIDEEGYEDSMGTAASSSTPLTPDSSSQRAVCVPAECCDEVADDDIEEAEGQTLATTNDRIAKGWWKRWARDEEAIPENKQSKLGTLRRRETTVTPDGRQHPKWPASATKRTSPRQDLRPVNRNSLPFMPQTAALQRTGSAGGISDSARAGSSDSERGIILDKKARLAEYRYMAA